MSSSDRLSRRIMLQGAGVSMTLPWLQSLRVWGEDSSSDKEAALFPKRFGVLFMACGVNPDHWWAKQNDQGDSNYGVEFGKSLV